MENEDFIDGTELPPEEFSSPDEETRYALHSSDEDPDPPRPQRPSSNPQPGAEQAMPSPPQAPSDGAFSSKPSPAENGRDDVPGIDPGPPASEPRKGPSSSGFGARPFGGREDREKPPGSKAAPPLNVYVATSGARPILLVRLFGLDVFGTWQLGRAARFNMNGLAILLTIVAFYEFISWLVLFNVILQAGLFRFSFIKTPLAAFLAIPFTVVTLLWEQQLVTSDFTDIWKNGFQLAALVLRLGIIGLVAFVNSQPIELLVFNYKIEGRLQQERARAEAVRLLNENDEKRADINNVSKELPAVMDLRSPVVKEQYEKSDAAKDKATNAQSDAKAGLERATRVRDSEKLRLKALSEEIKDLQAEQRSNDSEDVRLKLQKAEERASRISRGLPRLELDVTTAGETLRGREIDLQKAAEDYKTKWSSYDSEAKAFGNELYARQELDKLFPTRLRNFINRVENTATSDTVYEVGKGPQENFYTYTLAGNTSTQSPAGKQAQASDPGLVAPPRNYDWSDRMRVIHDLRFAIPPRWPELDTASKVVLANNLRFYDVCGIDHSGCSAEPPSGAADHSQAGSAKEPLRFDDHEQANREQDAAGFRTLYRIVFCLALVIPLFTIAMKFLMRTELKYYYSTAYQASRKHPEAWAFQIFLDRLRERRGSARRQPVPDEPAPDFGSYEG